MNFKTHLHLCIVSCMAFLSTGCNSTALETSEHINSSAPSTESALDRSKPITFATWNVEHLAAPVDLGCRPRTSDELEALKSYAAKLDADVVALQEVGSLEAIASVFPASDWQLFVSGRPDSEPYTCRQNGFTSTQQKVGYAVKKGIAVSKVNSVDTFGLEVTGLRYGLELEIDSAFGPISVLNLHLKSGCFVDNYSRADSEACQMFARQVPVLERWIEQKESQEQAYVIMGDLNHRISAPYNHLTQMLSSNSDGSPSSLEITTKDVIGCHPYYPAPIDHILLGNLTDPWIQKSVNVHPFDDMNVDNMLSDHCAISLTLNQNQLSLSNAVKWQTTSKEYQFLTTDAYLRAAQTIKAKTLPSESWVVVMDVDETILDNSEYQVRLNRMGSVYSPKTWNAWVAEQNAGLVPGVASFMQAVVASGGKFALITNRDRELDHHTWENLKKLGLPVNEQNTCLIGRNEQDERSINHQIIINDKDLRRQQITAGSASCYQANNKRHNQFPASQIIMQVGDNIEDFAGITQEKAKVKSILDDSLGLHVLLPNPMYGSW